MNAKEMAKILNRSPKVLWSLDPDNLDWSDVLSAGEIAEMLINQDAVILARVADVQRLTKERDSALNLIRSMEAEQVELHLEIGRLKSESAKAATVKESLTVPDAEYEVVRPDANGNVVWGDLSQPLACLDSYRYAFVCWIWSCGTHGEREAGFQLWYDDVVIYVYKPDTAMRGNIRTATRVGAVMRRAK